MPFLLLAFIAHGGGDKKTETFTQKDIFQTAHFLKNIPELIPDYQGQQIQYFVNYDGVNAFFTDAGVIYKGSQINYITKWKGANPHPTIEASQQSTGYFTFLLGKTEKELHSVITHGFKKIVYRDIYPGIDIEYSLPDEGGMKYNLIVHPGANISVIRLEYIGVDSLIEDHGNIKAGEIIEHAPKSYTNGQPVESHYKVHGTEILFSLPRGYDQNQTLIIDPWVTVPSSLTINNLGASVDYDNNGNLYAYGGGGNSSRDISNYHKLVKYDTSGTFLWVSNGGAPGWTSLGGPSYSINYMSNFKIDKVTNKIYFGQAFDVNGVQGIRLTSAGLYDNFISSQTPNAQGMCSFLPDCTNGSMLFLGGTSQGNSHQNIGFIDTTTAITSTANITNNDPYAFFIVSGFYDYWGNLYVTIPHSLNGTFTFDSNLIYKANRSLNGYVWHVSTGFITFRQMYNLPEFGTIYGNSNNFNGLAANASYLYYYDGYNLKAFDFATGNVVGTPTTIAGYTPVWQGGIAVDNCNHIYLGGVGAIKVFTFDGNSFTPEADIPLGVGFNTDTLIDVRYNPANNLLYVTGQSIAGTYIASLSDSCPRTISPQMTRTVSPTCNRAIVNVNSDSRLANFGYAYVWRDSAGNILRHTASDTTYTDTLTGLDAGTYTIQTQLNINCSSYFVTDTFSILPVPITTLDTAVCDDKFIFEGRVLTASGTYSDTLATVTGCDSIVILHLTIHHLSRDSLATSICSGDSLSFGGQILHSPGYYFQTLTNRNGCDSFVTLYLSVKALSDDTIEKSICSGDSTFFQGHYYHSTGTFGHILTGSTGCDSIISLKLNVMALPMVSWQINDTMVPCKRITMLTGGTPAGGTYVGSYVHIDSVINPPSDTSFNITYSYTDSQGCSSFASHKFKSTICTGIEDINERVDVHLYPNPNNGNFTLEAPEAIGSRYVIFDMFGSLIQSGVIEQAYSFISMPNASGIYALEVYSLFNSGVIRFTIAK